MISTSRSRKGESFMRQVVRVLGIASAVLPLAMPTARAQQLRPLLFNDLSRYEDLEFDAAHALTADGRAVAFTRARQSDDDSIAIVTNNRRDVWVQRVPGEPARAVTDGAADSSSWWKPLWSPDGKYLAMLSNRGGSVHVWLWSGADGKIRRLSQEEARGFVWIDQRHILLDSPWAEAPSHDDAATMPAAGDQSTAAILESGVPVHVPAIGGARWLLVDVESGAGSVITSGLVERWVISPDGKSIAYCRRVSTYTPTANEPVPPRYWALGIYSVEVYTRSRITASESRHAELTRAGSMRLAANETYSLRWSPDSRELAFIGYAGERQYDPQLYRFRPSDRRLIAISLGVLDPTADWGGVKNPRIAWDEAGDVLLRAAPRRHGTRPSEYTARWDWWRISSNGSMVNLTASMSTPPEELWPQKGGMAFVGVAAGRLWRIRATDGVIQQLPTPRGANAEEISWPTVDRNGLIELANPIEVSAAKIILGTRSDSSVKATPYWEQYWYHPFPATDLSYYVVDLSSGVATVIRKPDARARLVAFAPSANVVVFYEESRIGTSVWRTTLDGQRSERIIAANTFLRNVSEGEFRAIHYTSINGEPLRAWVLLPPGYVGGRRYPMITWVYPSLVEGPTPDPIDQIGFLHALSKQIPSAFGYAVLIPSMPMAPPGDLSEGTLDVLNGVMPAIDKAIALGIADSTRLLLLGHSGGGYATYSIVTQTSRFKAAVAWAGVTDLVSLEGTLSPRSRHADPLDFLYTTTTAEGRLRGKPPWEDIGHYLRNSPIFYVDRVRTPLLIIHGERDLLPVQQAEEFFMALYRQGKRAEFVRYLDEGHAPTRPVNIRDSWGRILAWCDEFADIMRDPNGRIVFDADHARSRSGVAPWTPEQFKAVGSKADRPPLARGLRR